MVVFTKHVLKGQKMRREIFADLHNHTTASDGDYTPEQLIRAMKEQGVSVVGVTDHDTIKGIDAAISEGEKTGIKVIPGVEVSVRFKEKLFTGTLHVLCYFPPELLHRFDFRKVLEKTLGNGRGDALVRARVGEINRVFGPLGQTPLLSRNMTFEEISRYSPTVTRRHFALSLNEHHHIHEPETINMIIGNDSPAYLPSGVGLDVVASFMDTFPVIGVLAHPAAGSFPGKGHYKEVLPVVETVETLLPRFLDAGIRGIEIHYPGHIQPHRALLSMWARQHDLVVTGGSDCHDSLHRPPGVEGLTRREFDLFMKSFYKE